MVPRILLHSTPAITGPGLHSGKESRLTVHPQPPGSGVRFVRIDMGTEAVIPVSISNAVPAPRQTLVSTVEHLLAALAGLGIQDAEVCLEGEELPALDGSALPFARILHRLSRRGPDLEGPAWRARHTVLGREGRSVCVISPAPVCEIQCSITLEGNLQKLWHRPEGAQHFLARIAPARTFGFASEAAVLHGAGLARGASLCNVLVFGKEGKILNPGGSRFMDEPVRHKVLDALGDIALLGGPLAARIQLERCSHRLLIRTLKLGVEQGHIYRV